MRILEWRSVGFGGEGSFKSGAWLCDCFLQGGLSQHGRPRFAKMLENLSLVGNLFLSFNLVRTISRDV
jgi:hypothetical protein